MSLTIDYIAMPPKSQEVSQIQTGEQTRINQEQQEVAMQFQNEVKQQSETTVRRRDVDNDELKNDERNNNKKKKKRRRCRQIHLQKKMRKIKKRMLSIHLKADALTSEFKYFQNKVNGEV